MTVRRPSRIAGSLAAAAILAFMGSAAGAQPFYVLRTVGEARTIIDPAAIQPKPGTAIRSLWIVTVQPNIVNGSPPQPGYVRSMNEYDCAAQTMRWRSFQAFSRSGQSLASRKNPSQEWKAVTPASGTLGEWRVACGLSSGDSVMEAQSVAKLVVALMAAFDLPAAPSRPAVRPSRKS